jgi:phenylalanyl-tRNA synthetase beta subunit
MPSQGTFFEPLRVGICHLFFYSCFRRLIFFADPSYFPGQCADIVVRGDAIGKIGVLHQEVIEKFDLSMPCSAFEINLEVFL